MVSATYSGRSRHTKDTIEFDIYSIVTRLWNAANKQEYPWTVGMHLSPNELQKEATRPHELLNSINHLVQNDEVRKWTLGEAAAPAYAEEYFEKAWGNRATFDMLRNPRLSQMDSTLRQLICDENLWNLGPAKDRADYVPKAERMRTSVDKALKIVGDIKRFYEYEAQVYGRAASLLQVAGDPDAPMSLAEQITSDALSKQSKDNGTAEKIAWWVADNVAERGHPDPCLHDLVLTTTYGAGKETIDGLMEGKPASIKALQDPLQAMADAYAENAKTLERIEGAIARIPQEVDRQFRAFERSKSSEVS